MSRVTAAIVIALFALLAGPPAFAQDFVTQAEEGFVLAINESRAEAGLEPLVLNEGVRDVARPWAVVMADANDLHHNPDYASQYEGEWVRMGENVGVSRGLTNVDAMVASLHQAFMNSTGHRRNILGSYNQVGIGVVQRGSTFWVTVNFLEGPMEDTAPEAEAQEPAPSNEESFAADDTNQSPEPGAPYHRRGRTRRAA